MVNSIRESNHQTVLKANATGLCVLFNDIAMYCQCKIQINTFILRSCALFLCVYFHRDKLVGKSVFKVRRANIFSILNAF